MKDNTQIDIRPATKADTADILSLIQALADYEKLRHKAVATLEDLEHSLFGEHQQAEVLLACLDNKTLGFALFFHNYSTFLGKAGLYLEDLFVKPEARGLGIGKKLLARLAQIAKQRDCARMEWAALDWNQLAIDVYQHLGAKTMDDWTTFRLEGDALDKLALQ